MQSISTSCHFIALATCILAVMAGCEFQLEEPTEDFGASDNNEETGWQERGNDPGRYTVDEKQYFLSDETYWDYTLSYTDVVLSPDGTKLLAMAPVPGPDQGYRDPGLVLVVHDLPSHRLPLGESALPELDAVVLPEVMDLVRINFSPDGREAYLLGHEGKWIAVLDLDAMAITMQLYLDASFSVIDVTPDGDHLVLSNLPTTDHDEQYFDQISCVLEDGAFTPPNRCEIAVVDLATGTYYRHTFGVPLRDIDFSPAHDELVLTTSRWDGDSSMATVTFFDYLEDEVVAAQTFENCADELVVQPGGVLGLLSPSRCSKEIEEEQTGFLFFTSETSESSEPEPSVIVIDPISVIDLETRTFLENLPGFGPVSVTPDGSVAVGFTYKNVMEEMWDYHEQQTHVGLIFVRLPSLTYKVLDYGDEVPTYTMSPSTSSLVVWEEGSEWSAPRITSYDLDSLDERPLYGHDGLSISLDAFSWLPGGERLMGLYDGNLYEVDVAEQLVSWAGDLGTWDTMSARPQGDFVILGRATSTEFGLFTVGTDYLLETLEVTVPALIER